MDELVKVAIPGEHGDDERIWAESLGRDRYRVRNIPLSEGICHLDVLRCEPAEHEDACPRFVEVLERGPNDSLFVHCLASPDEDESVGSALEAAGEACATAERFTPTRYAFSVPRTSLQAVLMRFETLREDGKVEIHHQESSAPNRET